MDSPEEIRYEIVDVIDYSAGGHSSGWISAGKIRWEDSIRKQMDAKVNEELEKHDRKLA